MQIGDKVRIYPDEAKSSHYRGVKGQITSLHYVNLTLVKVNVRALWDKELKVTFTLPVEEVKLINA